MKKNEDILSTIEIVRNEKLAKRNKLIIGIFLLISMVTVFLKVTDTILLDLGFHDGKLHLGYAHDTDFINKAYSGLGDISMKKQIERHPNFFWTFTQFTWITTFMIIIIMSLRYFKYDQKNMPTWLRWIMTQSTISLIAMYDLIVGAVFWSAMFKGFSDAFNADLWWLELFVTILVHSIIPIMTITYSIIYLIKDPRASILKEKFVLKGMIYPSIYIAYYILIAVIWQDPYPITNLHQDFAGDIWKLPFAFLGIYSMLGVMLIIHNWLLLKYNKPYNPKKDYEILMHRKIKIEKIKSKVIRKNKK